MERRQIGHFLHFPQQALQASGLRKACNGSDTKKVSDDTMLFDQKEPPYLQRTRCRQGRRTTLISPSKHTRHNTFSCMTLERKFHTYAKEKVQLTRNGQWSAAYSQHLMRIKFSVPLLVLKPKQFLTKVHN